MTDNELLNAIAEIIDMKLEPIQAELANVNKGLTSVNEELTSVKEDLDEVKRRITAVEMTIENEVTHNIKIIAEGHLDLSRKLNETIHIASDIKAKQEIQDLYIKSHDSQLKIKEIS